MLAAQALTVQEATGNRLTLGIGLAHQAIVEDTLKVPFKTPARHMDEYLSVLVPALTKRSVSFSGSIWSGDDDLAGAPDAMSPSLLVAAMGPRMLRLAGGRTDGTILWLSGPRTIASAIRPILDAAAFDAGRPPPRIVAGLPVCVTNDPGRVRQRVALALSLYGELPSYRAVLDTEGCDGPADVALIGDEADIRAGLAALAEAGATDFAATEFGTNAGESIATRRLLAALARE
jgi:F420-dependent oxidoreductase-like protein